MEEAVCFLGGGVARVCSSAACAEPQGRGEGQADRRDSENEQRGGARGGCMTRRRERMRLAGFEEE